MQRLPPCSRVSHSLKGLSKRRKEYIVLYKAKVLNKAKLTKAVRVNTDGACC